MRKTRIVALITVLVLLVSMFAACNQAPAASSTAPTSSAAPAGSTPASSEAAPAAPLSFTMMCTYNGTEPPKADAAYMVYFQEALNTTIDMTWVPNSAYNDKLAAQIAAVDLPQVAIARDPKSAVVVNAARSGMLWPLSPYVTPEYESFDNFSKGVLSNMSIDGVLYAFPREREMVRAGTYYRQDWMDNLNLETPKNMADIYEICRAFTEDDPDGNGVKDTVGLALRGGCLDSLLRVVTCYYGGPKTWLVNDDGSFTNEVDTPEFQMALDFYRDLYSNGYMISDFAVVDDELLVFSQGRAGILVQTTANDGAGTVRKNLLDLFPDAEVGGTMEIYNPNGELTLYSHTGFTGSLIFPKIQTKTEEELLPILSFFNELGKPEHAQFMNLGHEGTHYTIVDGFATLTAEQKAAFDIDMQDNSQIHPYGYESWYPVPKKQAIPLGQYFADHQKSLAEFVVYNPAEPFISETQTTLGNTLSDIVGDAKTKYIMGEIDLAGWQKAVADWKAAGGDKVAEEFAAQYKAVNG